MKNPIKHLKHMWKDPINTIEEADARKKEVLPWFFGSLGAAVVFSVVDGMLGTGILMILGLIGIFGVMAFGFMLFVIKKAKEKFEALTCAKCNTMAVIKTPEEYAEYVSYTYGEYKAIYDGVSHPASNNGVVAKVDAKGHASVTVDINLKCPHCGNVKPLVYQITPFRCSETQEKVAVSNIEIVKMRLENSVKAAVKDFNDPEKRPDFPYSIHSKKNPNYENRGKPQVGKNWKPTYNGVTIDYHKDVEEMVDAFFLENQLDGKIIDPAKPKKSK